MRRGTARGEEKRQKGGGASHSSTTKTCRVYDRSEERERGETHSAFISAVNLTFTKQIKENLLVLQSSN